MSFCGFRDDAIHGGNGRIPQRSATFPSPTTDNFSNRVDTKWDRGGFPGPQCCLNRFPSSVARWRYVDVDL
jgi:hypothetical protein